MDHDLSGEYVLVSEHFYYFGKDAIDVPEEFSSIIKKGPGHKSNFNESLINEFIAWLRENYIPGKTSDPFNFKGSDNDNGGCGL
jgi:hypothetical protein